MTISWLLEKNDLNYRFIGDVNLHVPLKVNFMFNHFQMHLIKILNYFEAHWGATAIIFIVTCKNRDPDTIKGEAYRYAVTRWIGGPLKRIQRWNNVTKLPLSHFPVSSCYLSSQNILTAGKHLPGGLHLKWVIAYWKKSWGE